MLVRISSNFKLRYSWPQRYTDRFWDQKVKGQGHNTTTHGHIIIPGGILAYLWNATTYLIKLTATTHCQVDITDDIYKITHNNFQTRTFPVKAIIDSSPSNTI